MHCSAFSPVAEERTANNGFFFVNLFRLDETYCKVVSMIQITISSRMAISMVHSMGKVKINKELNIFMLILCIDYEECFQSM